MSDSKAASKRLNRSRLQALFQVGLLIAAVSAPCQVLGSRVDLPRVQTLTLETKDKVKLACRYFPGTQGKQTIPVIMLHGWTGPQGEGAGHDIEPLAKSIQQAGHAVAVPDLRGHGRSRTSLERNPTGEVQLNRDRFGPRDLRDMLLDVEAVRSFLSTQHNEGQLNLNLLCVVGFELGSIVALNWIDYDWNVPSFPTLKQGQDVKAFVLVSPQLSFRGFSVRPALDNETIRHGLSALVIYGKRDPKSEESRRLFTTLRRSRRSLPAGISPDEAKRLQDLFLIEVDTRLRGSKLLEVPTISLDRHVLEFIDRRLVPLRESSPWNPRKTP